MRSHKQPDGYADVHGDARRANLRPRVSIRGFPRSEGIAGSLQLEPFVRGVVAWKVRGRLRAGKIVLHPHAVAIGRIDRRKWSAATIGRTPNPIKIWRAGADIWRDQRIHVGRSGCRRLLDHHSRLRPRARFRLVAYPGDDGSVAVQCLVDIVELVIRSGDIGACSVEIEGLVAG